MSLRETVSQALRRWRMKRRAARRGEQALIRLEKLNVDGHLAL